MCTFFPLIGFVPLGFPIKVFNEATSSLSHLIDDESWMHLGLGNLDRLHHLSYVMFFKSMCYVFISKPCGAFLLIFIYVFETLCMYKDLST